MNWELCFAVKLTEDAGQYQISTITLAVDGRQNTSPDQLYDSCLKKAQEKFGTKVQYLVNLRLTPKR